MKWRWSFVPLSLVTALSGCGGVVAAPKPLRVITGAAEPCDAGRPYYGNEPGSTGPTEVFVTASRGSTLVATQRVIANPANHERPTYRLTVPPGSYVVRSLDGGAMAQIVVMSARVSTGDTSVIHLNLLPRRCG